MNLLRSLGFMVGLMFCLPASTPGASVTVRMVEGDTGDVTPAMICLTDAEGKVRLPPDGRVLGQPSSTREFYQGVTFQSGPGWIGPVRKMQGKGDNNDRSYVYELLPSIPYWSEPVMYQVAGEFTVELPEGEYRIAAEHGMEYVPVRKVFRVGDSGAVRVSVELDRWIDLPRKGWWSGDVHVHHPTLQQAHRDFLLSYARAADLHVVNVLEMGHHQGTDFKQLGFGKPFRVEQGTYALVSGQEEPRSTFGHIIGLNISSLVRDVSTYDLYDLAFQRIHAQPEALVGFAHFSWNGCDLPRGFPWYVTTEELDFIELLQFSKLNAPDYHDYLNMGFHLTAAAGSDTPWGSTLGEVRTYVQTGPDFSVDAWFDNLRRGRTFVSNGPFLQLQVDGRWPGDVLARRAGDKVEVIAKVESHAAIGLPKFVRLYGNGGLLAEAANPGGQASLELKQSVVIDQSQWLAAFVVCENGALAHSTPVYVTVDGRPTWCPDKGPGLVLRQLDAIKVIEEEVTPPKDARQRGIRERLDRAKRYYADLRERMQEGQ